MRKKNISYPWKFSWVFFEEKNTDLQNVASHVNRVCVKFVRAWAQFQTKPTVFLCKLNLMPKFLYILGKRSWK